MEAQVYKIHSDFYYLKNEQGQTFTCKLREILKKQKNEILVGDFVEISEDLNFITSIKKRKNSLPRPKSANIDLALIVCSILEPNLDYIQLNRYLTFLKYHNIDCAICFNKEDLDLNLEKTKQEIKAIYEPLGYKIFFISAKNKSHLEELSEFIKNKTTTLCGQSGAGKSTLLNSLSNSNIKTGDVSTKTKRGCHTTRHCEIIEFENYKIMDTPGFSCLKFDFILPDKLLDLFDDIKSYAQHCKYSNCLHNVQENGVCNVFDNLDKIAKSRYESYLCFLNETLEYKKKISKQSIKKEDFKKNVGSKIITKISKRKREESRNTSNQKFKNIKDF